MATPGQQQVQEQQRRNGAQWARNRPLLFVDITLGLLFFAAGKITGNLTTGRRQMRP